MWKGVQRRKQFYMILNHVITDSGIRISLVFNDMSCYCPYKYIAAWFWNKLQFLSVVKVSLLPGTHDLYSPWPRNIDWGSSWEAATEQEIDAKWGWKCSLAQKMTPSLQVLHRSPFFRISDAHRGKKKLLEHFVLFSPTGESSTLCS